MSNCKSSLRIGHFEIDLKDRDGMIGQFWEFLSIDNDLVENEDYFDEDTLELGYEDEASRLLEKVTKGKKINTLKSFEKTWGKVFNILYDQEYWAECQYNIIEKGDGKYIVYWAIGGRNDWDR
jgi:hypothetical protein